MKVEMRVSMAGDGVARNVGDVVDVPDDEASRLIEKEFAVAAKETKAKAAKKATTTETAAKR